MDWAKKHADTVLILGGILSAVLWLNSKLNDIEKDIAVMRTVLIMKEIYPSDLAHTNSEKQNDS